MSSSNSRFFTRILTVLTAFAFAAGLASSAAASDPSSGGAGANKSAERQVKAGTAKKPVKKTAKMIEEEGTGKTGSATSTSKAASAAKSAAAKVSVATCDTSSKKAAAAKASAKPGATAQPEASEKGGAPAATASSKQAPAKDDKVYDLGNITVVGEDRSRLNDGAKKKTAYLTIDAAENAGGDKKTAEFVSVKRSSVSGEPVKDELNAYYEGWVGNYSTSHSEGRVSYDNGSYRSTLDVSAEESGGYRFKSDYRDLRASYNYECDETDSGTRIGAGFSNGNRNLPGFSAFTNNYAETETGTYFVKGRYSTKENRFDIGVSGSKKDVSIPAAGVTEKYDSMLLSAGIEHDMVLGDNPLTLEMRATSDMLDLSNAQSASKGSVLFGLNAEKAVSEKFMVSVNPEIAKNGDKSPKIGGTVTATLRDNFSTEKKSFANKYRLTLGRQARKYDTISFLFPDENSLVWAKDGAGANLFDANTYERDEQFAEIAGEMAAGDDTKITAAIRSSKTDGLLYYNDLNGTDARHGFAAFADGAKTSKFTIGAEHRINGEFKADLSASSTSISDSVNGLMPYIPKYEYILGLDYTGARGLTARIAETVKTEMDSSRNAAANAKVPTYSSLGLTVSKSFNENGKIIFKADNILGSDLKLRPGYEYRGRSFGVGLNYRY